ncbi:manganese-dependent inorganic pyrophosphatase [Alicyclobacillus acidocaldarius]|uniref:Probable manganese-dependent inorganic pyrophosphatase n=1 Tax=Alicyclobacillus acidocaldarius subsp. acidocaldarius (strain ATCC 27009 / DSM 446 / BCRC 14685 / JCM 5260 / KCTC 1825 / NBRC 15652 / NCIMB 11725 / NRRL B-14509 / 104-IA) TaxID=521098 RepID=C8WSK6_ALIAD|nr:manganese-dependent inorganic pyrophosphatase [Alicyclobacillus acidocaldarius]ACV59491.1 Inorganic diphosphatase [Alicyclobacillus acidocaldarius subsp. acidocaldarius DSM 446]
MAKRLIFGHRNPDTDAITSAIAYAHLKRELGEDVEPVALGEPNPETQFVLSHFGVSAPRVIERVAGEVDEVILVDHNERQQSAPDADQVKVVEVIDHHRIANFETADPLYYRAEPVGCTATILNKLYKEKNVSIPRHVAGIMLSAIISDTLLLKSPTCTEEDVKAARELAELAGVKLEEYGLQMLKAGADLSQKTVGELLTLDAKEFQMGNHKVEIAQVNAVDVNDVLAKKAEILQAIEKKIAEKGLDLFFFVVTDILNNGSVGLALGRAAHAVEEAYGVKLEDHQALLKGVVSRKKQIVPVLTEVLSK